MDDAPAAAPIGPVALGSGRVLYAPGMRAGPWVFASGHMAQDYGAAAAALVLAWRALAVLWERRERRLAAPDNLPERACGRCRHWDAGPDDARGDCRLDPPRPAPATRGGRAGPGPAPAVYPETAAWDQCGSFEESARTIGAGE